MIIINLVSGNLNTIAYTVTPSLFHVILPVYVEPRWSPIAKPYLNPAENSRISAIAVESAAIIETGRNRALRFCGRSDRPTYLGIVSEGKVTQ